MATNRFLTPSDLLPAMGLLCSAASSEIDKIIESPDVAPEFQSVVKKYNSPVNTILHPDQMPSELKTIVTAVLADVSEVMVVLKSGQNIRKMGQRPADIIAAMSLPAWIEAAFDHGHAIIASKQRIAAVKKAASWSAEVQGVLTRNGLPMCVVTFGLEVRKNHIRATAEAYSLTKIESAKPWLEAKFPHTHENAAPGGGPGTQEAPSRSGEAQQDVENLLRAQAAEIGGLRTRIGTLEGLVHNLKARIELLEASDGSDDDEHSERYSRHGATGGNMPHGQAIMRLIKATPKSTRASTGSSSCPTPSVVSVVKLRDLDTPVICSFLPLRILEASHIWNFWS